jgi:hypothetical protein
MPCGIRFFRLARAIVRVRVRPSVIRVRRDETAIRAVVRVAAEQDEAHSLLPTAIGCRFYEKSLRFTLYAFRIAGFGYSVFNKLSPYFSHLNTSTFVFLLFVFFEG